MSIEIVPLSAEHLDAAAEMVAARYRAARAQIPFLPALYSDAGAIVPRLRAHVGNVPGVVALDAGRPAGFIMSLLVSNHAERLAYVPDFGHAARTGQEYTLYRRMYAEIADRWLANGCFLHAITLYPEEEGAQAGWFSLGFGLVVMDALRVVNMRNAGEARRPALAGIEIRRAQVEDTDVVAGLERGLSRHLAASPAFLPLIQDEKRAALKEWIADRKHALWMAFRGGEAVAYLRFEPSEQLVLPTSSETTIAITGAFTLETLRGAGIGSALLQTGLEWAGSAGYAHCSVDFESANLPGSAFWLRHFEPVAHSLMRRVDSRLAWAHAQRDEADLLRSFEGHTWIG
jgi:GNAT superfamily N-acetyltransferase